MAAMVDMAVVSPTSKNLYYDEADRIEAYRYMTRLVRAGLEGSMEAADPAYPTLRPLPYGVKIGQGPLRHHDSNNGMVEAA